MSGATSRPRWRAIGPAILVVALGSIAIWNLADHGRAQELEETDTDKVAPDELELYIRVYTALQDNHDLNIETAIQPYHISLDDFRQLERRIQNEPRMVDRVREALLEHVRARDAFATASGTPTPTASAAPRRGTKRRQ